MGLPVSEVITLPSSSAFCSKRSAYFNAAFLRCSMGMASSCLRPVLTASNLRRMTAGVSMSSSRKTCPVAGFVIYKVRRALVDALMPRDCCWGRALATAAALVCNTQQHIMRHEPKDRILQKTGGERQWGQDETNGAGSGAGEHCKEGNRSQAQETRASEWKCRHRPETSFGGGGRAVRTGRCSIRDNFTSESMNSQLSNRCEPPDTARR